MTEDSNVPENNDTSFNTESKSRKCLSFIERNNPENKPQIWFIVNLTGFIAAIIVSVQLSRVDSIENDFPVPAYIAYSVGLTFLWCIEAFSSSLSIHSLNGIHLFVVYVELIASLYFLSSFLYFTLNDPSLSTEVRRGALPSTEIDIVFYGLAFLYNLYCFSILKKKKNMPTDGVVPPAATLSSPEVVEEETEAKKEVEIV